MSVDPQGQRASFNGADFEGIIENVICDVLEIPSQKWGEPTGKAFSHSDNILWKNVPYESIYGTKCRSEFVLNYAGRRIRIECKSQQSPGSVDEKLPYLVKNFTEKVPEEETIIITNGSGFRDGALEWLREACMGTKCIVHTSSSFIFYLVNLKNAHSKQAD